MSRYPTVFGEADFSSENVTASVHVVCRRVYESAFAGLLNGTCSRVLFFSREKALTASRSY